MKASNILSFNFQMDFESIYLANFKLKVSLLDGPTQLQQNYKQKNKQYFQVMLKKKYISLEINIMYSFKQFILS